MKKIALTSDSLILDTETTGLDSKAEICELSIIDSTGKVLFNSLIKPLNPIPAVVTDIHGINDEMVANAPYFADVYNEIITIIKGKYGIIYNADYDLRILSQCAMMTNLSSAPFDELKARTHCAMKWYSQFRDQPKWVKLVDSCQQMNINISQFTAHRALADCHMTLELIKKVNSKLGFMKGSTEVRYLGTPASPNVKIGIYEDMVPGSTIAKVMVNGKREFYDISLLEENIQMTNVTELKTKIELPANAEFDIEYTLPGINFNADNFKQSINDVLAPVKELGTNLDKKTLTETLAKLRKFQKEISDRRIAIVKEIKQPIADFETVIKNGDAEIDVQIEKYTIELNKIVDKENMTKRSEIEKLIPGIVQNNNLNTKYAAQLTFIVDYFLTKWTLDKIKVDLVTRAEALYKQQDYERIQADLRNTQIESRTRLIERLNSQYNQTFTYADFPLERFTDEAVNDKYLRIETDKRTRADNEKSAVGYTITEQTDITETEMNLTPNISSQESTIATIPLKSQADQLPELVYKNLRLGGVNQMAILKAVAKLKTDGLSVEFI